MNSTRTSSTQSCCRLAGIFLIILTLICGTPALADNQSALSSESAWQSRIEAERSKVIAESKEPVEVGSSKQILRMLEGLAYCLAVFLIGFHIYKKYYMRTQISGKRNLKVLESVGLSAKTYLHLVEADNQRFLVSSGQQQVSLIKLDDELGVEVAAFRGGLGQAIEKEEKNEYTEQLTEGRIC